MKIVLTLAAMLAISTSAHAAPAPPTAADVAFANQAGDAAARAARAYNREYAKMYRADPIGTLIEDKSMMARASKPKSATALAAAKPVQASKPKPVVAKPAPKRLAVADNFSPAYMASLKNP